VKAKNFRKHTIENPLTITGYPYDGTLFQGSATVRIMWLMPRCGKFLRKFLIFPT